MNLIEQNKAKIIKLCEKHKIEHLYVFGSVLTNDFNEESDIDFLIEFSDIDLYDYFDNFYDFKESLTNLFNRKIDIVEEKTLRNPILIRSIERNKKLIYGRKDSKMAV